MPETAPCDKCESEIPTSADRCPECGFEPSPGAIGWVGVLLAVPAFVVSSVIVVAMPVVVLDGAPLASAIVALAIFAPAAAMSGWLLWTALHQDNRTPTDPSVTE